MYTENNWEEKSFKIIEDIRAILGPSNVLWFGQKFYSSHPVWLFSYPLNFNLTAIISELTEKTETFGWQVVDAGLTVEGVGQSELPCLVVAPLLSVTANLVYHVTPLRIIPVILQAGLLPSNVSRALTDYPDTSGKIHASLGLQFRSCEGDGAAFWVKKFEDLFGEPFGVLAIDLTDLPLDSRVYRDTHSHWGVVIDRVEMIEPHRLREVLRSEYTPILPDELMSNTAQA